MTLDDLAVFPQLLQHIVASVPEIHWTRRPSDDSFALVEHAWHLADLEEEGFGARIERMLTEDNPQLPDFNGAAIAEARRYIEQPLRPALERFVRVRAKNAARFERLSEEQWARGGTQELVGEITLHSVFKGMLQHDIAHANEIVALLRDLRIAVPAGLEAFAQREPLARSA